MGEQGEEMAMGGSDSGELSSSVKEAPSTAAPPGLPAHMKGAVGEGRKGGARVVSIVVGARCGVCDLPLAGATVQAMHRHFHEACFTCKVCQKPLVAEPKVMNVGGIPHCNPCGQEAFSSKFKIGGFLPGAPGPILPGGSEHPVPGSTIAADLAVEDPLEPRELDHSTLRRRARGPTGRNRPTRSRAHTERFRERYNTIVGAEPVKAPAKKKLRGRKNVVKCDTSRPSKAGQVSPKLQPLQGYTKKVTKRQRHVPPKKALPRTPPQKALPPTPPPKKKVEDIGVSAVSAGEVTANDPSPGPPTPPAKDLPDPLTPLTDFDAAVAAEDTKSDRQQDDCKSDADDAAVIEEEEAAPKDSSARGPPPTPPPKPQQEELPDPSGFTPFNEFDALTGHMGEDGKQEGCGDEVVSVVQEEVEVVVLEEEEEEEAVVVVSLDLSGNTFEESDEEHHSPSAAMPSVSDSLAGLREMQRDFERNKKQNRMSVWERKKREELANTLAQRCARSPRFEPERGEDQAPIDEKEWEEAKEKERQAKAASMHALRLKREAEEQKRKTKELTAIRSRLAALDEMDDEELKEVLGLDEHSTDDGIEVEEVDDVVTFNFEDVIPGCIEGYLQKANASSKLLQPGWRTRWFRLQEDTLVYYRERQQNVLAKDNLPDGIVSLGSVQAIEACAPLRDSAKNSTFKIVAPERTYLLQADSKGDMEIWLKALNRAKQFYCKESILASAPIAGKEETEMAGHLDKLGKFKWHKRYFILKGGILFRYKTGGEREQMGKLPLYGTELTEYRPDKFDRCFMLKDSKGNELILRASTEEDMHSWLNAIIKQKVMIEETVNSIVIM